MYGRSAIWFPLALLTLLAALTLWIDRTVQPPQPRRDGSSRHDVDYRVNNFSMTKSDQDGNPRYVLSAVELAHYPDDDSTTLVRPRFTQYAASKPYTQIQGQRGQVSSNGEHVYFMDHVQLERGAMPDRPEMKLLTEYLHMIPDQDIVETNQPVSILQAPRTVIRAMGMEYNKRLRILQLTGRVHVHYEKPGNAMRPLTAPPAMKHMTAVKQPQQALKTASKPAIVPAVKKPSRKQQTAKAAEKRLPKTATTTRIRRHYENATH